MAENVSDHTCLVTRPARSFVNNRQKPDEKTKLTCFFFDFVDSEIGASHYGNQIFLWSRFYFTIDKELAGWDV